VGQDWVGKMKSTRSENLEQERLMEEVWFPHCTRLRSRAPEGLLGGQENHTGSSAQVKKVSAVRKMRLLA